jgi:hypothetical protein
VKPGSGLLKKISFCHGVIFHAGEDPFVNLNYFTVVEKHGHERTLRRTYLSSLSYHPDQLAITLFF